MPRPPRSWLWGIAFGLLYWVGSARTAQWADASKLTLYALAGYAPSLNPGDHAGWTVLAWLWLRLFPGDPIGACHRLSALAAAVSLLLLVELLRSRGEAPAAVRGAAAVWGVAHAPWWAAELTETYAMATALTLASLLAAAKGRAFLAGLGAGWAASCHGFTLFLTLPALVRGQGWLGKLAGLLVGTAPLWLALALQPPVDPLTDHHSAGLASLRWHWDTFLAPSRLLTGMLLLLLLLLWNLGPLGWWGWLQGKTRSLVPSWTLLPLAILLAGYAPFRLHLMVGLLVLGLVLFRPPALPTPAAASHVVLQALCYLGIPLALTALNAENAFVRELPFRVNAVYFLNPMKGREGSAELYAERFFAQAPERAVVLADFNPGAVLKLLQTVRGLRPDLTIIPTAVDNCLAAPQPAACLATRIREVWQQGRPVVLADTYEPYYRLQELRGQGITFQPMEVGALVQPLSPREGNEKPTARSLGNTSPRVSPTSLFTP
ncbi:MAG: hypothetical protein NZ869_01345 [Thermoanaerobaculum sp.]|nr:hypothetical protein [Thermoanaerobaculum sp.]